MGLEKEEEDKKIAFDLFPRKRALSSSLLQKVAKGGETRAMLCYGNCNQSYF